MSASVFTRLKGFRQANAGLAALEFALLAPMMVFLLLGSVDLLNMLDTNRRLENATVSLADVVARDTEVSNDEINGIWAALDVLMVPGDATNVDVRLSSVSVQTATRAVVVWSEGRGMAARGANSQVDLPAAMMIPGTSLIMTESEQGYTTPLGILTPSSVTLRHQAFRRSRRVDPIPRV